MPLGWLAQERAKEPPAMRVRIGGYTKKFSQRGTIRCSSLRVQRKENFMANSTNSLSHTNWLCKYHIVIVPKYRRKVIYNEKRKDL